MYGLPEVSDWLTDWLVWLVKPLAEWFANVDWYVSAVWVRSWLLDPWLTSTGL